MAPIGQRGGAVLAATIGGSIALAKRAKGKQKAPSEVQTDPPVPPPAPWSGGGPICAGLRVVELASIVAGPVVARSLADWGAEVIKVEPPEGDLLRGMPAVGRDQKPCPRTCNATFEYYNMGKAGVQLDIAKPDDCKRLLELLDGADVFVTNVRVQSLAKAGLLYKDIKERCPRLVYAHLTGWGADGLDAGRPGVDAGPCWSASGLAGGVNGPQVAGNYPIAFGDTVAGYSLLAGVLMALADRDGRTGKGQFVDASLLRAGLWCAAPGIMSSADSAERAEGQAITDYSIEPPRHGDQDGGLTAWWSSAFPCGGENDFIWFDVLDASPSADAELRSAIAKAVGLADHTSDFAALSHSDFRQHLSSAIASRPNAAAVMKTLHEAGVSCAVRHVTFNEAGTALFGDTSQQGALGSLYRATNSVDDLASSLSIQDFSGVPTLPISFSSNASHGPRAPAFRKGEHTNAVLKRGWASPPYLDHGPVPSSTTVAAQSSAGPRSTCPLSGCTIVELSMASDLSASAACCQLAEHGASVFKMPLVQSESALPSRIIAHYDRLKRQVEPEPDLAACLDARLSGADVFITNVPEEHLQAQGISLAAVQSRFPGLVVMAFSPWGSATAKNAEEAAVAAGIGPKCGALGALWAASGLAATMQGYAGATPPTPLLQMPELCASVFGFAAVAGGLYARLRARHASGVSEGGGQQVDVSYLGVGLMLSAFVHVLNREQLTRSLAYDNWAATPTDLAQQVPFSVLKSSDGQYFMLYDMRPPAILDIRRIASVSWPALMGAMASGIKGVVTDENAKKVTGFLALRKILQPLNQMYGSHFSQMPWQDISNALTSAGVWHNRVAMPYQMAGYPTASAGPAAGVTCSPNDGIIVHSPVFLSATKAPETIGWPPIARSKL